MLSIPRWRTLASINFWAYDARRVMRFLCCLAGSLTSFMAEKFGHRKVSSLVNKQERKENSKNVWVRWDWERCQMYIRQQKSSWKTGILWAYRYDLRTQSFSPRDEINYFESHLEKGSFKVVAFDRKSLISNLECQVYYFSTSNENSRVVVIFPDFKINSHFKESCRQILAFTCDRSCF